MMNAICPECDFEHRRFFGEPEKIGETEVCHLNVEPPMRSFVTDFPPAALTECANCGYWWNLDKTDYAEFVESQREKHLVLLKEKGLTGVSLEKYVDGVKRELDAFVQYTWKVVKTHVLKEQDKALRTRDRNEGFIPR